MTSHNSNRTALITGASAGIGASFARVFASKGFDLVLTARREDRLHELARELKTSFGTQSLVIPGNLADPDAPEIIFNAVTTAGVHVDALVNNAGYGVPGYFQDSAWQEHRDFIQVMVTAPAHLSYLFEPGMVERDYGRIINVASLAAFLPGPAGHTVYGASKAFMLRLSESLANEHANDNIHICALCPGFTYSEFHDVTGNRAQVSKLPKLMWMSPDDVAKEGYDAVMAGRPVRVNGLANHALATLTQWLPSSVTMRLMRGQAAKLRPGKVAAQSQA